MSWDMNLENIHDKCRICLKEGDVNIWNCKISLKRQPETNDDFIEKSFVDLMDVFSNSQDLLNLTDLFPLLCWQCLEDLKFCFILNEKMKVANIQLKNIYEQSLNQCIEEEHLIEVVDENEINEVIDANLFETLADGNLVNQTKYEFDNVNELTILSKTRHSKQITPDKNDSFIVTQFIPETLDSTERNISNQAEDNDGLFQPPSHLLTVNFKAVEVKDLNKLESIEPLCDDINEAAIYVCQYCPQAFAKLDYLQTHVQKSHVCKFCTQPFSLTQDLFRHIREAHTENKCAICHKMLSSRTNLRHHIKRVHRIKLPAKVTLIDFIKSTPLEENNLENDVEILQEELGAADVHLNAYDSCTEIFDENNE